MSKSKAASSLPILDSLRKELFGGSLPESEWSDFEKAVQIHSPRSVRVHPTWNLHQDPLPFETTPVPWFSQGRILSNDEIRPSQFLHYAAGGYYIQDAGSMLALALLNAQPGEWICDLCAAPGGKASGILEAISKYRGPLKSNDTTLSSDVFESTHHAAQDSSVSDRTNGFLLANEPIKTRVPLLHYALARTGSPHYAVTNSDPIELAEKMAGLFDAVLVDAPCSGQTMVARGKRDSNAYDTTQIEHSVARQRRILLAALKLLKPGGRLVYSTCTFNRDENESQIEYLQQQFPGVCELINNAHLSPWKSPLMEGCYRLWPHRDPTDGAFAASLKWNGELEVSRVVREKKSSKRSHDNRSHVKGRLPEEILVEYGLLNGLRVIDATNHLDAFSAPVMHLIRQETYDPSDDRVLRKLNEYRIELPSLVSFRGKVQSPEYALAKLDPAWFHPKHTVAFSDSEAIDYMNGQAIAINPSLPQSLGRSENLSPQSWAIATWRNRPLGWMKLAGNRWNNHLPSLANVQIAK